MPAFSKLPVSAHTQRAKQAALLLLEIEDASRITGAGVNAICRYICNDPNLYRELDRGRQPQLPNVHRYRDACHQFVADWFAARRAVISASSAVGASSSTLTK